MGIKIRLSSLFILSLSFFYCLPFKSFCQSNSVKSDTIIDERIVVPLLDYTVLSRLEFSKGVDLYNKKQYKLAINSFIQSDSLMFLAKGEESNFYGHGIQWAASCYYKMGLDSLAKEYSEYYNLPPIDMRLTLVSDSILDLAESIYQKGDIDTSLKKYLEASEVEKENLGESYWYANTLSHCAELYKELGNNDEAIRLEICALNIREVSPGVDHIDYFNSLMSIFDMMLVSGKNERIMYYGDMLIEYMDQHKKTIGLGSYFYPIHTCTMAKIYAEEGNPIKSLEYCNKTIESAQLIVDLPNFYTTLYHGIILTLKQIGQDSLACELCKQIIPVFENKEELLNNERKDYSDIINIVANHYYERGDFISAYKFQEKALGILEDKKDPRYGTILSNLSLTYCELGRIEEAIGLAEEAVGMCDNSIVMNDKSICAKRLINLASCYSIANRPKDALRIGKKCFELLKEEYGIDYHLTLVAANNLAVYYNELGYHDELRKLLVLVIENAEKNLQNNGDVLGTAYNNLAMNWYRNNHDLQESIHYVTKSYEIRKKVLGDKDLYTIQSLYNRGRCLLDMDILSEGVGCIIEALNQTKEIIGENNLRYITMKEILPIIYGRGGNLCRALEIEKEISTMLKIIVGEEHMSYLKSVEMLAELLFFTNDTLSLFNTIIDESKKYRRKVICDFPNYTSVERANAVNEMSRFFDWLFPLVCYYNQRPDLHSELYNALLLRKGILLNSEIELSRIIRESGDFTLVSRYNQLVANTNLLNKQLQLPIEQRLFDIDSLKNIIIEDEQYMVSTSKEYGGYIRNFEICWEDIRGNLNDEELCVEFVAFDDTCRILNRNYFALVIDKNLDNPELIPLCTEEQINEVIKNDNIGGIYQLIWNPILQKKKNVKTIFFSPGGILNNLGIEYVDINDHENISDIYSIYRLSSTREILDREGVLCKNAALYGGLEYAVDMDVLIAQSAKSGVYVSSSVMYRGLSDSLSVRNSFEPLYNTKTEISEISKTLKKGYVSVSMYSDTDGTEESFKALSGKGMNLIHLATHGMYVGAFEAESKKRETNLSFIQLDENDDNHIQEDKSLSRSFLVMSGGDMLPSHKEIPDNLEDGILTALEISKLDLRGLDLVVLSACQTALGDIDYEGVYGLQRGFKKAGANTILMSLDKVDDEATKILMIEFYRNLMEGNSKHQSLRNAQRHLRQVENGKYDNPKYWASFIMLDGLN